MFGFRSFFGRGGRGRGGSRGDDNRGIGNRNENAHSSTSHTTFSSYRDENGNHCESGHGPNRRFASTTQRSGRAMPPGVADMIRGLDDMRGDLQNTMNNMDNAMNSMEGTMNHLESMLGDMPDIQSMIRDLDSRMRTMQSMMHSAEVSVSAVDTDYDEYEWTLPPRSVRHHQDHAINTPPPLPSPLTAAAFINKHTAFLSHTDTTHPANDSCPICLDDIEQHVCVRIIGIQGCNHLIGLGCLEQMLKLDPSKKKECPLCRTKWTDGEGIWQDDNPRWATPDTGRGLVGGASGGRNGLPWFVIPARNGGGRRTE